jgi:hypothetical protein
MQAHDTASCTTQAHAQHPAPRSPVQHCPRASVPPPQPQPSPLGLPATLQSCQGPHTRPQSAFSFGKPRPAASEVPRRRRSSLRAKLASQRPVGQARARMGYLTRCARRLDAGRPWARCRRGPGRGPWVCRYRTSTICIPHASTPGNASLAPSVPRRRRISPALAAQFRPKEGTRDRRNQIRTPDFEWGHAGFRVVGLYCPLLQKGQMERKRVCSDARCVHCPCRAWSWEVGPHGPDLRGALCTRSSSYWLRRTGMHAGGSTGGSRWQKTGEAGRGPALECPGIGHFCLKAGEPYLSLWQSAGAMGAEHASATACATPPWPLIFLHDANTPCPGAPRQTQLHPHRALASCCGRRGEAQRRAGECISNERRQGWARLPQRAASVHADEQLFRSAADQRLPRTPRLASPHPHVLYYQPSRHS